MGIVLNWLINLGSIDNLMMLSSFPIGSLGFFNGIILPANGDNYISSFPFFMSVIYFSHQVTDGKLSKLLKILLTHWWNEGCSNRVWVEILTQLYNALFWIVF